jgi:isoquinoline 1-oxidoreductase beta subunit
MNHVLAQPLMSRRFMLKCLAGAGGSLILGFNLPSQTNAATYMEQPKQIGRDEINAWIEIAANNHVTIRVPHTEQGQGGLTSVVQMVVEELDCALDDVTAVFADMNRQVNEDNPYINTGTAGSALVRSRHPHLCLAGASARERLKEAAAQAWGVARSDVLAKQGKLSSGSKSATYGEFAAAAAAVTLEEEPKIKAYGDWWLMGKDLPRIDIPMKVDGSAKYCIDTELDDMVYVAVRHCPVPWGKVVSYDKSAAEAIEGVHGVVEFQAREGKTGAGDMQNAIGVVADSWYTAKLAVDLIPIEWDFLGLENRSDDFMKAEAARLWEVEGTIYSRAEFDPGEDARAIIAAAESSKVVTNEYMRPFETHARMEPINATVWVQDGRVDVWSPTQNQATPIETVADELGIETKNIYSNSTFLGGAFGGNGGGNTAVTREAAVVSQLFKRPAKVIWSREEDINHDKQRPPHYIKLKASIGDDGLPVAYYSNAVWFPFEGVERIGPAWADATISDMPYSIPNRYHEKHDYMSHIPTATHRGPGCNANGFISEQFADELAIAGGWDPLEWRLALTKDSEPWQRVLLKMKEVCGFTTDLPKGEGMGIAIVKDHGAYAGACAKVSVSRRGQLTIEKVTIVTNAGYILNPRAATEQCHGAVHWEMSHALTGGLRLEGGKFINTNFDSYTLLRMSDSIPVEVHFASSEDQWWGGMGEPAGPPTPPAVANAIYFATGRRITSTPILNHDLTPL